MSQVVRDAAIEGAALVAARTFIAVDTKDIDLVWAKNFGVSHPVNAREFDQVEDSFHSMHAGEVLLSVVML